ncbi:Emp46p [Saccharomyces paradoxus]|uniref:Emp46p n=1 Tax=Saccharomyces paradoxus TaxID=27291 RepID=A0A8B8UVR1_SACPA|nr:Emp46 [Saccharomyces paradoxus]QHS74822.1 Emp46 [Saccharomyces paradoxus]
MTPSTPPRSRGTRCLTQPSGNTSSNTIMQPQRTPQKPSQNLVPVTPSTTKPFKNVPLLAPPNSNMGMTSPFNGLTSPQRSPFPKSSVKRTLFQFESHDNGIVREEQESLGRVNRILFPTQQDADIDEDEEVLLPPSRPTSARQLRLSPERDELDQSYRKKIIKDIPGTPSDKVITFELAKNWNNYSPQNASSQESEDEEDIIIKPAQVGKNPFVSDELVTQDIRNERKKAMLRENPDIEDVITYVNKKGEVVEKRKLTDEEKRRFKPKALIFYITTLTGFFNFFLTVSFYSGFLVFRIIAHFIVVSFHQSELGEDAYKKVIFLSSAIREKQKSKRAKAETTQNKMHPISGVIWLYICVWIVHAKVTPKDELKWNKGYSLPNLLEVTDQKKELSQWTLGDKVKLEEGRFILTPGKNTKGSLWLKPEYTTHDAMTIEWTFRSFGFRGSTKGGLAFWLKQGNVGDGTELFGGSSKKFDGLMILLRLDDKLGESVTAYLNDGSKNLDIKSSPYFASCLFQYQDSMVPSTLRLTYDPLDNHLLKLQMDNRVCFQTRKVKFVGSSFKIGTSAINDASKESFEILKTKLYDGVIEDSLIPNVNPMGQPRVVTKVINSQTGEESFKEKTPFSEKGESITSNELFEKINKLEGKIMANDINPLLHKMDKIVENERELIQRLRSVLDLKKTDRRPAINDDSFQDFLSMNSNLDKLIKEQERIRLDAKLHSERTNGHDEIFSKISVWLVLLIFIMITLAYYMFRINQDIKKVKLL